jgi:hypothetical protein
LGFEKTATTAACAANAPGDFGEVDAGSGGYSRAKSASMVSVEITRFLPRRLVA